MSMLSRAMKSPTLWIALVGLAWLPGVALSKSEQPPAFPPLDQPHYVEDFAYGEFLYDYYQQRYFAAITSVLVSQERGFFEQHQEHAELLLGSLYVSYGMLDKAEQIFRKLIDQAVSEDARNQAWFHLATLKYKRGDLSESKQILANELQNLTQYQEWERRILLALIQLQQGDYDQAVEDLNAIPRKSRLDTYAKYNLGVAFAGLGQGAESTDLFDAVLTTADKTGRRYKTPKNEKNELFALKDKSALALGVNFLNQQKYDLAKQAFGEIRLDGPFANPALLGLGWAHFNSGYPQQALTPWFELRQRTPADPAVQEVFIHIPYVYEEMGALQDALDGYRKATKLYNLQEVAIGRAKQRILAEDWIDQLSPTPDFKNDPMGRIPPFQPPKAFETFYLYQFFASHHFNEGYRNYRELQRLEQLIQHWLDNMPVYANMIDVNRARMEPILEQTIAKLDTATTRRAQSAQILNHYQDEIDRVLEGEDLTATATAQEKAQWQTLQQAERRLLRHPESKFFRKERDKLEVLKGVWLWDQVQQAPERRWQIEKAYHQVVDNMDQLNGSINDLKRAQNMAQERFVGFNDRLDELETRLQELIVRINQAQAKHQGYLQKIAIQILDNNLEHLGKLKGRAYLAVARLQDISYSMERRRQGFYPDYDEGEAPATNQQEQPTDQPQTQPSEPAAEQSDTAAPNDEQAQNTNTQETKPAAETPKANPNTEAPPLQEKQEDATEEEEEDSNPWYFRFWNE